MDKKFSDLMESMKEKGYFQEPVHFKGYHLSKITPKIVPQKSTKINDPLDAVIDNEIGYFDEPVHFKGYGKKNLKEAAKKIPTSSRNWLTSNENGKYHRNLDAKVLSEKVSGHHLMSHKHIAAIKHYTNNGYQSINKNLHNGKTLSDEDAEHAKHLSHFIKSNPMKHHLHVYSGGRDPRPKIDKTGHIRHKAFMSLSHDKHVADGFSQGYSTEHGEEHHFIHIHLKPGDHAANVERMSEHEGEHETILNKGTKLKHTGSEVISRAPMTRYNWEKGVGEKIPGKHVTVHVHHFEIAKDKK